MNPGRNQVRNFRTPALGALGFLCLLLAACNKPPSLPSLFGPQDRSRERIALDDGLSVADFRALFNIMNRNRMLDPLKPYLEAPSPEALSSLAKLVSDYFYETACVPSALLSLLADRVQQRAFTRAAENAREQVRNPGYRERAEALIHAIANSEFPQLLSRDVGWIEPDWSDALADSYREAQRTKPASDAGTDATLWDWPGFVRDITRLIQDPQVKESFRKLAEILEENDVGTPLVKATRHLRQKTESAAFTGFGLGLSRMLKTPADPLADGGPNQLDRLLKFAEVADSPTDGLFRALAQQIDDEPGLTRELISNQQPVIPAAISKYLYAKLFLKADSTRRFTKEFWLNLAKEGEPRKGWGATSQQFFETALMAMGKFTQEMKPESLPDSFEANYPKILNAYALTKWGQRLAQLQTTAEDPTDLKIKAAWDPEADSLSFLDQVQKALVPPFEFEVSLVQGKGADARLTPETLSDLSQMKLSGVFLSNLKGNVSRPGFGVFHYMFSAYPKEVSFREALTESVRLCDQTRPLVNSEAFPTSLAYLFTPYFAELESENLMNALNRELGKMESLENWRAFKSLLFDKLELANLSDQKRSALLRMFDGKPELQDKLNQLLDTLPMLYEVDEKVDSLPSPFETYYTVATYTPAKEMQGLTSILSFISKNGIFSTEEKDGKWVAKYPAIFDWVGQGTPVTTFLRTLSYLPFSQETGFSRLLREMFHSQKRPSGVDLHLTFLQDLLEKHGPGVASWLSQGFDWGETTRAERAWGLSFVRKGDHIPLWKFFSTYGTRKQALALVRTLEDLRAAGYLGEAFRLLAQVQDVKLKRVSQVFLEWQTSGELKQFLNAMQTLLEPLL